MKLEKIEAPNVRDLVAMNLEDKNSRYLMLIGRPDVLRCVLDMNFKENF